MKIFLIFLVIFGKHFQVKCIFHGNFAADATANEAARHLFDDLLSHYNKLVRPVKNHSQTLQVRVHLKLSQLLDVHEKEQIMKTNVWLRQEWYDTKLVWNPDDYDGIQMLYIPSSIIWTPDIVLYDTAGGHYEITIMTKAHVHYNGFVVWEPPAVFHSMCEMNVMWFPFDQQECKMKFGAWSYDGYQVDLIHYDNRESVKEFVNEYGQQVWRVENGIDLSEYHPHVEWDILQVPGERHFIRYPCCEAPFVDVTYYLLLRRKTLFYTVNLIIPCVGISCLTVFIFYLPADSGEKIVMCISILISLNALFLLLVEIIPSTSIVMPLIVRYLLFTMILVTVSVAVTVVTLNIHHRSPSTHRMPKIVRSIFLYYLPPILGMQRPSWAKSEVDSEHESENKTFREKHRQKRNATKYGSCEPVENHGSVVFTNCSDQNCVSSSVELPKVVVNQPSRERENDRPFCNDKFSGLSMNSFQLRGEESQLIVDSWERRESLTSLLQAKEESKRNILKYGDHLSAIRYVASCTALIAHKIRREAKEKEIVESWGFVAMVIDRLFWYIFAIICVAGTISIIFQAPSLYDTRKPIG